MNGYNLTKAADRARYRADRQAEREALDKGLWPRDTNDALRWNTADRAKVRRHLTMDLDYIDDVEARLAAGHPDLRGWEGWVAQSEAKAST